MYNSNLFICRESQRKREIQSRKLELLFRSLQVHHKFAEDAFDAILPSTVIVAEVLIVTTLYCLIRLYSSLHFFLLCLLLCISLFTTVLLTLGIWLAVQATEYSEKYIELGRSRQPTKSEDVFLRSCRKFKWKIGNTFVLSRDSLPTIYRDIIVTYTINLLLTFK